MQDIEQPGDGQANLLYSLALWSSLWEYIMNKFVCYFLAIEKEYSS